MMYTLTPEELNRLGKAALDESKRLQNAATKTNDGSTQPPAKTVAIESIVPHDAAFRDYQNYVGAIFRPGDALCFVGINHKNNARDQEFVPYEKAVSREYFDHLREANEDGSIYLAVNAYPEHLVGQHEGRTQENVAAIRVLQVDADHNGAEAMSAIKSSALVPQPSIIVESSPGKFQGVWLVDGITKDEAKPLMQAIASEFKTDSAVAEVARVMRVPGFVNRKYESAPVARTVRQTNTRYTREQFKLHVAVSNEMKPPKSDDWYKDVVFQHKQIYTQMLEMVGWFIRAKNIKDPDVLYSIIAPFCENAVDVDGKTPYHCDMNKVRADIEKWCKDPKFETGEEYKARTQVRLSSTASTQQPDAPIPQFTFKYPAVQGSHRDYVVSPALGQTDGWFPLGAPSLVGGSSGSGKTTWVVDILEKQTRKENVYGHRTYGRPYLVIMHDRGDDAFQRTMERMSLDANKIPIKRLPPITGDAALQAILNNIEEDGQDKVPQIVFLEGADMLVEDANKGQFVVPFMSGMQQIAERYHIAFILSVGAPKMRIGEGYVAKRDSILGSEKWSRMAEAVVALQYVQGDDTDEKRACFVMLRNAPAEKFDLIMRGGKLVIHEEARAEQIKPKAPEILWFQGQAEEAKTEPQKEWWTVLEMERSMGISNATARRWVADAHTKGYIIKKRGPDSKVKGKAPQYKWNASKTNPLWRDPASKQPGGNVVSFANAAVEDRKHAAG